MAHISGPALPGWRGSEGAPTLVDFRIDGHVLSQASWTARFDRAFDAILGLVKSLDADGAQLNAGDLAAVGATLPRREVDILKLAEE